MVIVCAEWRAPGLLAAEGLPSSWWGALLLRPCWPRSCQVKAAREQAARWEGCDVPTTAGVPTRMGDRWPTGWGCHTEEHPPPLGVDQMASHITQAPPGPPGKKMRLSPDTLWGLSWGGAPEASRCCCFARLCLACVAPLTWLLVPSLAVSEPQAAHSPLEKPSSTAILCNTCGNVCKGEVLRVQNKYFHIKCFVCKGEHLWSLSSLGVGRKEGSGRFQRGLRRGGAVWALTWSKEESGGGRRSGPIQVAGAGVCHVDASAV